MPEIPRRVDKPWGYEIWWARTERYVGKILHLNKGESLSLQYHRVKEETIRLQSGRLLFETRPAGEEGDLRRVEMAPGDVVHIAPATKRRSAYPISACLCRKAGIGSPGPLGPKSRPARQQRACRA